MQQKNLLSNYKCIVTGGPTREWIDPVRYLTNPSTGKMGKAIADAADKLCKETVFIHGPVEKALLENIRYRTEEIETTEGLLEKIKEELTNKTILIMAAAPADYRPEKRAVEKIKKHDESLTIKFVKNPDVLKSIYAHSKASEIKNFIRVGFAAETENVENYAKKKLHEKSLHMICVNDVSQKGAGFGGDTNIITLMKKDGQIKTFPIMSKKDVAEKILLEISTFIEV